MTIDRGFVGVTRGGVAQTKSGFAKSLVYQYVSRFRNMHAAGVLLNIIIIIGLFVG